MRYLRCSGHLPRAGDHEHEGESAQREPDEPHRAHLCAAAVQGRAALELEAIERSMQEDGVLDGLWTRTEQQ